MTSEEVYQSSGNQPRFFYGYIVVALAFVILFVSWGLYCVFGVFLNPLMEDFGWTSATTAGAFSVSMAIHGVLGIVMGGLADKFGPRVVVTFCGLFLGLGCLLMSQVSALWHFYLFYGVLIGIGISGVWVPLLSGVARWFVRKRSQMTGVVVASVGISGLITPLVLSRLIAAYGWRLSFVVQGVVILLVMVLGAQFLKRPAQMGLRPYGEGEVKQTGVESGVVGFSLKEAICTAQFWIFCAMFVFYGFCISSVLIHIVPHVIDLGIPAVSAANILAALNGTSILGNFGLGSLGDRVGSRWVFIISFILMLAALSWLLLSGEMFMLYCCAVFAGVAIGGMSASESPLVAQLFGMSSHGLIFAVVGLGCTVGAALGPVVTGYIFDISGGYQLAFMADAACAVLSLILLAMLRPTKRLETRP